MSASAIIETRLFQNTLFIQKQKMKTFTHSNRNRHGLTLIELLLVLIILIGLASILVPLFGNITGLTHGASSSANIEEVTRNLENHKAMYGKYPSQLDQLLHTQTAAQASIVPFGGSAAIDANELTTTTPTDRTLDALEEAGITSCRSKQRII